MFLKDHVTEDWSNDAENTAKKTKHFKAFILNSNNNRFYCIFDQIHAALRA